MVNDDSVDSESEESDYYSEELVQPTFSNIASPLPDFNDSADPLKKKIRGSQFLAAQSSKESKISAIFPESVFAPTPKASPLKNLNEERSSFHKFNSEESKEGHEEFQEYEKFISMHIKKAGYGGKLLISPESKFRIRWDLIIMFLVITNCFEVPYSVAFTDKGNDEIYSTVIDSVINIFFILDIFINFITTFNDPETKEEVTDHKRIAKNYIKGRFWIDLLASIPFDYFVYLDSESSVVPLDLFKLFKLVRILRLSKLISYLNIRNEVKSSLRLIKLVFFLVLFLHCLGCGWFYIAKQNKDWIPPLDYVFITTEIYEENSFLQYCSSLYHAVLMLGGNDIGPRGEVELLFMATILCICAIVNAIIFGNFTVMLQSLNRRSTQFQEKLENATDVMKNMSLHDDVKEQIKYYIEYTENTLQSQNEMNEFFKILSPSLKKRVMINIFQDAILENEIFQNQEIIVSLLCEKLSIKVCVPEEKIITQGDDSESMYFISNGVFDVFVTNEHRADKYTSKLSAGNYFGEVGLLKNCKRTATVISRNYGTCAELSKVDFEHMIDNYTYIPKLMDDHIHAKYNDNWRRFMHRAIKNIDYFSAGLPNYIINEIGYKFDVVTLSQNNYLYKAGEACECIYIVSQGEIDIFLKNTNRESYLDTLYTGCTIGSYSCISNEYYTTSAKAKTECTVFKLHFNDLTKLRKQYYVLDSILSQYEEYIQKSNPPVCDYNLYRYKSYKMSAKQKLMLGIRRLNRIIRSYQTYKIQDLLNKAREKEQIRKSIAESRRKTQVMIRNPMNVEQRNEQSMLFMNLKLDSLTKMIQDQSEEIDHLKNNVDRKLNLLLKAQGIDYQEEKPDNKPKNSMSKIPTAVSDKLIRLKTKPIIKQKNSRRKRFKASKKKIVSFGEEDKMQFPTSKLALAKVEKPRVSMMEPVNNNLIEEQPPDPERTEEIVLTENQVESLKNEEKKEPKEAQSPHAEDLLPSLKQITEKDEDLVDKVFNEDLQKREDHQDKDIIDRFNEEFNFDEFGIDCDISDHEANVSVVKSVSSASKKASQKKDNEASSSDNALDNAATTK